MKQVTWFFADEENAVAEWKPFGTETSDDTELEERVEQAVNELVTVEEALERGFCVAVFDTETGTKETVYQRAPGQLKVLRCPTKERYPGDLVGCGSANLSEPDEDDGMIDCYNCGIFFTEESIESIPEGWPIRV
jgi:hypothetical protein